MTAQDKQQLEPQQKSHLSDGEPKLEDALEAQSDPSTELTSDSDSDGYSDSDEDDAEETTFSVEDTILIFDWDDTVLPSSWLQDGGFRLDGEGKELEPHREELEELARRATETLRVAQQLGKVVLVTNAERGWIEMSCRRFLPTLMPALGGVAMLSARTRYESPELPSPFDWKVRAFEDEIGAVEDLSALPSQCRGRCNNVISIGDSAHEREALLRVCAPLQNCRAKSLKLMERPEIQELVRQHELLAESLPQLVHHDGNLDLYIRSI